MPFPYKAGYMAEFRALTVGKPEKVEAEVYFDDVYQETVEFAPFSWGGGDVWILKYFAKAGTPKGTQIKFNLTAHKGTSSYNFNINESWDGHVLTVVGNVLEDLQVIRTN